jgi:hypothetical protein
MRRPCPVALLVVGAVLAGCASSRRDEPAPGAAFFAAIRPHCGQAYAGRLVEGTAPGDAAIGAERLVMHVRDCTDGEVRIPFHVGANRSRTWIVSRRDGELLLKHDHRHEDGSADRITQYGGPTRDGATGTRLEFFADAETAALIPASATNIWTMEIVPGERFVYALRREAENRRFRVEFDLARPVEVPPPAW